MKSRSRSARARLVGVQWTNSILRGTRFFVAIVIVAGVAHISPTIAAAQDRTEVVPAGPLDEEGRAKQGLAINTHRERGSCDTYSGLDTNTYRCGSGNTFYRPCWREGVATTATVLCMETPWTRTVDRFRVLNLLLDVGIAHDEDHPERRTKDFGPWGIELEDGNRCSAFGGGAHSFVPDGRDGETVDYYCDHDVVLTRTLRRSNDRPWRIHAFEYRDQNYKPLGDAVIRRAYVIGLPAAMQLASDYANAAAATAERIYRAAHSKPTDFAFADRVRLDLPGGQWANVRVAEVGDRFWNVVLHRSDDRWFEMRRYRTLGAHASIDQSLCARVPLSVRHQLFANGECVRLAGARRARRGGWVAGSIVVLVLLVATGFVVRRTRRTGPDG